MEVQTERPLLLLLAEQELKHMPGHQEQQHLLQQVFLLVLTQLQLRMLMAVQPRLALLSLNLRFLLLQLWLMPT